MKKATGFNSHDDLAFFGRVNASISHELKNSMAIISETAGLSQDLTEMAIRGQKTELEMLKTCNQEIIEEIQRGFAIIKQMNRFSHSVDDPIKKVDLSDVIDLMAALSKFLSFSCKIRSGPLPEQIPPVLTRPFRLQNLIYQALVFAFESAGTTDGQIAIELHPAPGSVHIDLYGFGPTNGRSFACDQTKTIADSIGIEILETDDSRKVTLIVPECFDESESESLVQ